MERCLACEAEGVATHGALPRLRGPGVATRGALPRLRGRGVATLERCLACEAEGSPPAERCLACEADSVGTKTAFCRAPSNARLAILASERPRM
jgi:hypothetical protein